MLRDLHSALRRFMYEKAQIDSRDVDIRVEAPTREWVASLIRPTLSLFLLELTENTELRSTYTVSTGGNGRAERRLAPRRFDLRYLVSVLTTEIRDEHELLWRVLVALMRHPQLPAEVLPESLRGLEPPITAKVSKPEDGVRVMDLWNALGTPPRPALVYVVTVPVDLEIEFAAPLVLTRTARYTRQLTGGAAPESGTHIGGTVRDRMGSPVANARVSVAGRGIQSDPTDEEGRYLLSSVPTGRLTLRITPPDRPPLEATVEVPSASYDVTVD